MRVIEVRNVCKAWEIAPSLLGREGVWESSRNGPALVHPRPVATVYQRPMERVLFCGRRRTNPFFHLFESMWMLAGRDDGAWLDQFVGDFSVRYAEPSGAIHGAYGHRWRRHFARDQIVDVVELLRRDPTTRQAVLAMWDPATDLDARKRDVPCNTTIYLRLIRQEEMRLNMTVCCRSNDIVWGCYGANAVHMSILQEVIASAVGARMGTYTQVSNNWHMYKSVADQMFPGETQERWVLPETDYYGRRAVAARPMFELGRPITEILHDVHVWVSAGMVPGSPPFVTGLLEPMLQIHRLCKSRQWGRARELLGGITHTDWREAASTWIDRGATRDHAREVAAQTTMPGVPQP